MRVGKLAAALSGRGLYSGGGILDDRSMQELNYRVGEKKEPVEKVAAGFMRSRA